MRKKNGLVRRAEEEKRMDSNKIYLYQLKCNLLNKCIKKKQFVWTGEDQLSIWETKYDLSRRLNQEENFNL